MADVETPSPVYLAQRRDWSERYGIHVKHARQWRMMAFVLAGTTAISTMCAVWESSQSRVTPYLIKENAIGERIALGPIPPAPPINADTIIGQLSKWIIDTRTIYTDPTAEKNIVTEAYNWIDRQGDAAHQLDEMMRAHNPFIEAAKKTVGVKIKFVGLIGGDTWSVDWDEETIMRDGTLAPTTTYWRAAIRIKVSPPTDMDALWKNNTGIYIEWFNISMRAH